MVDLARWLGQQLDTDEQKARAAQQDGEVKDGRWYDDGDEEVIDDRAWRIAFTKSPAFRAHIAVWDPARVLREIDAKRGIVARYEFARHEAAALDIGEEERKTRIASAAAFQSCAMLIAGTFEDRPGYAEAIASVE